MCQLTHTTTKLRKVVLGSLVLLVLVDPLVEVGSEEVGPLGLLQQAGPVSLVQLLLLQFELDVLARVVDFGSLVVDLGVKLQLEVVGLLERIRVAGEGQTGGLEVELQVRGGHIRHCDGQVNEILLGVGTGGPLGPENCVMSAEVVCCVAQGSAGQRRAVKLCMLKRRE